MQLPFSPTSEALRAIEATLSKARLDRYLERASQDKYQALRLYLWNIRLCEAFYLSTQICEVAFRNAIHGALREKHGENWFERGSFLCTLPTQLRGELDRTVREERGAHGSTGLVDQLVSGLSLGFWLHLLTKNYQDVLWPAFYSLSFPHKPRRAGRTDLYEAGNRFRVHRNRIAHHKPIFDRSPSGEYENIKMLIGWICPQTLDFVKNLSRVPTVLKQCPQA